MILSCVSLCVTAGFVLTCSIERMMLEFWLYVFFLNVILPLCAAGSSTLEIACVF